MYTITETKEAIQGLESQGIQARFLHPYKGRPEPKRFIILVDYNHLDTAKELYPSALLIGEN